MHNTSKLKHINPFLYYQKSPWPVRLMGILGLITTILAAIGFVRFLDISPWYWAIFGPIIALFLITHVARYILHIQYPRLSKEGHLKFVHTFWEKNPEPTVDIFLPWAGEDLDIYESTLSASVAMHYSRKQIYLLDDKGSAQVEDLAKKYGAHYLSRPNKGEYRKSGNLQYGYEHSSGEFAFVLDADFIPLPEALWHTIPYIASDATVGILQTPQYFDQTPEKHKESPIEFGGGNIVEEFYKIDQVCRDKFDAAICVGTSAIYRRKAIMSVGGTPKVWGTEDVRTGLLITRQGYHVKYIPLIMSIGTSPEDLQGYFRQHNRWCTGSLAIVTPGEFYTKAKLSFAGKLIYLLNPAYYVVEALNPILVFHIVALLLFHSDSLSVMNSLWFLPKVILTLFIVPLFFREHRMRLGTRLAALNNMFTYFYTIFCLIPFKTALAWHPAGVNIGGVSNEFRGAIRTGIALTASYVILLIVAIGINKEKVATLQTSFVILWAVYIATWYMIYIYHATHFLKGSDTQYTHPTSKIRTRGRRTWAHIKHAILPALTIILFIHVGLNTYVYSGTRTAKPLLAFPAVEAEVASSLAPAVTATSSTSTPSTYKPKNYTYQAISKDTVTRLAQQALIDYRKDTNLVFDPVDLFYAEAYLSKLPKVKMLRVGTKVAFSSKQIQRGLKLASTMSEKQRATLIEYMNARNIIRY